MKLRQAIKQKNVAEIRKITKTKPIAEIVASLESLSSQERLLYFRLLKTETQSDIFSRLDPEYQEQLIKSFSDKQMKEIIGELYSAELADIVEEVPEEIATRVLKYADNETRNSVNKILKYNEDQTGSLMNVDIILLKQSLTIGQAITYVKKEREDSRLAHYFFVTDSKARLVGYVAIEDLLFGKKAQKLSAIVKPVGYVTTTTDKEEAAREFAKQDMSVLPVINSSKEVIGMITSDEVIDIVTEEATEDIQRMAGIEEKDDTPYLKKTVFSIFKSRVFWLMLLMLSATISQIVLDSFQGMSDIAVPAFTTAIVAIIPVISGAAGNAGSQSSTTVIRALAVGEITTGDYLKVIWKEIKVSILMGVFLALANIARLIIYYAASQDLDFQHIVLSLAASLALFIVIVLAKFVGGMLPLIAKKLNRDPAVMAAPLLTTLIDALSTMIFFGIAIGIMVLVI